MQHPGITILPDGSAAIREFITLPAAAEAAGAIGGHECFARELALRGITPDGVVLYGGRRLPIFERSRVPDLRASFGTGQAV